MSSKCGTYAGWNVHMRSGEDPCPGVAPGTLDVWCHRGHVQVYGDKQVNLMDVLARVGESA